MAAYGAELKEGKSPTQALAYVATLLEKNTVTQPDSASDALQAFVSGQGDVLLDYESDAIAAKRAGDKIQIVYPEVVDPDPDADRGDQEVEPPAAGPGVRQVA